MHFDTGVTYMINTHENADLSLQTGFDFGVETRILFDNLHGVLLSRLSTCRLVDRCKISGSEFHAEHVLIFECLCSKRGKVDVSDSFRDSKNGS